MNEIYLSDSLVIKQGLLYNQTKLVKRHNWHTHLRSLGWEKLHRCWITKLNKLHNPYPTNSLFGSLECGDDGDCLFHCISAALNVDQTRDNYYDNQDIRDKVADSITEEQFQDIISCYRCMKDIDDFDEQWDPYDIHNLTEFQEQVRTSGHNYWGDYLLLQLISQVFSINIFVLTQNEETDTYEEYPLAMTYNPNLSTVILVHENESHFRLVGHFQGYMKQIFTHLELPLEIKKLYNLSVLENK